MHTHLSLFEGGNNAFHEPSDPYQLSKVGEAFIAGLLRHAPELTAITNAAGQLLQAADRGHRGAGPRRLGPRRPLRAGAGAGVEGRQGLRRCGSSTGHRTRPATRYLAFSVILAAGLRGIQQGYELPAEATAATSSTSRRGAARPGLRPLPQSLAEALDRDGAVRPGPRDARRAHVQWFLRNKRAEWGDYKAQVTPVRARPLLPRLVMRKTRAR